MAGRGRQRVPGRPPARAIVVAIAPSLRRWSARAIAIVTIA
jgi:hypothetical protein